MPGRPFLHESVKNDFWRALSAVFFRIKSDMAGAGDARIMEAAVKELIHDDRGAAGDVINDASQASDALDISNIEKEFAEDGNDSTENSEQISPPTSD